jgi:hypothetical protein
VELPLMELRVAGEAPVVLTSLEFPHRYADAYLRDNLLGGVAFDKTELGRRFRSSSLGAPVEELAHRLGRNPGGIRSRMMRLGLAERTAVAAEPAAPVEPAQ